MQSLTFYWSILRQSVTKFIEDDIMGYAAALSYYTIFSLPPILLVIVNSMALVYDRNEARDAIFSQIGDLVGKDGATQLANTLDQLGVYEEGWWAAAIGIGALLFTATTVFVTIQNTLNKIFRVKPKPKLGWLKMVIDRLISLTTLLGIAFILVVSLSVNALISEFGSYLAGSFPDGSIMFISVINFFLPLLVITLLFSILFKYLPDAKLELKETLLGGLITALLFSVGKYGISFYVGNSQAANLYDAAGAILVIMLWVFYASVIFFFGAVFTFIYAKVKSDGIQPSSYAVKVEMREIEIEKI